jgi:tetratricopeptide (TPR) repeat protein
LIDPGALRQRTERALGEGRFPHARELAASLMRLSDTPAHRELHLRAAMGRANELQNEGRFRDAAAVLSGTIAYLEDRAQIASVAESLARCGDLAGATRLAEKAADPQLAKRLLGFACDADLRDRCRGNVAVPADLHAQRAVIRQAFGELQAGQDDRVLTTLQAIGLASPYLEWKLLLRGFLAYYQNDDARALDNWQRLEPQRLPFRLAAPFRALLDPSYRQAQTPESQRGLASQLERMQGSTFTGQLRHVQQLLGDGAQISQAFREADALVAPLKAEAPHLLQRLAACFFWAIIDRGYPEDLKRYERVFGGPAEDPKLWRLEALALEHRLDFETAHEAWQNFEKNLAQAPGLPANYAKRMRALVWQRMGHNAATQTSAGDMRNLPLGPFAINRPQSLRPEAEICYAKSLELAPDLLGSHAALIHYYLDRNKQTKALQAAKRLLKRFPDHVPTLTTVGELSLRKGNYKDALAMFTRALQINPLDARLRVRLCATHASAAAAAVEKGDIDRARAEFQTALALDDTDDRFAVLASWAACEFKAGAPDQAEALLQQANAGGAQRLAVAFQMLVSTIRLQLGKQLKKRFESEVNRLLAEPPTVEAAVALARFARANAEGKYVGQKGHEKKVVAYIDKVRHAGFNEGQLLHLCTALADLKSPRLLQSLFRTGQQRFPNNPRFYLAEAEYYLSLPPRRTRPWRVKSLLAKVRELVSALAVGEREPLLQRVEECEEKLHEFNPMGRLFDSIDPDGLFGFEEEDEEFDEESDLDDERY